MICIFDKVIDEKKLSYISEVKFRNDGLKEYYHFTYVVDGFKLSRENDTIEAIQQDRVLLMSRSGIDKLLSGG